MQHNGAEVIDPMSLVGVLMGQKHRVDVIDIGVDQLLAQIGRSVDHDPRYTIIAGPFREQRAAASAVFRIVGITGSPAERRAGNAGR
jgi:hypothetical protein